MKFHTTAYYYLDPCPNVSLRPETAGSEAWEEDSSTVSSLDLGSKSIADQHIQTFADKTIDCEVRLL
jgi:hypothetical protein